MNQFLNLSPFSDHTGVCCDRLALANACLALAARLGNHAALRYYDPQVANANIGDECGSFAGGVEVDLFDIDGYLARQSPAKQKIAC